MVFDAVFYIYMLCSSHGSMCSDQVVKFEIVRLAIFSWTRQFVGGANDILASNVARAGGMILRL